MELSMSHVDFRAVRNLLRWIGSGVAPSIERATEASRTLSRHADRLPHTMAVVENAKCGILASPENCRVAEDEMVRIQMVPHEVVVQGDIDHG